MKQITPEIKARVFALYYNQQAVVTKGNYTHKQGTTYLIDGDVLSSVGLGSLIKYRYAVLVNPLSSITDEDAIEVGRLVSGKNTWIGHAHYGARGYSVTLVKPNTTVNVVINISNDDGSIWDSRMICMDTLPGHDYLRSKGYALPYLDWSVDELVEAGVFKLKEN